MPVYEPDENDDDRDLPLEQDIDDDDDESVVVTCPSCGEEVYEESEQCPSCGDWIMPRAGGARLPRIWLIAAVAAIGAMVVFSIW